MTLSRLSLPITLGLALAACGGLAEEAPLDAEAAEASATFDEGGAGVSTTQAALRVSDTVFDFDPTLDGAATPEVNAENIRAHVSAQLPAGCAVTREGSTVTLSFGPPPGCTVGDLTLTGTVIVSLTKQGSVTTASLTFTDVTVDGVPLSGSAVFTTTDGSTFDVALSLTKDTRTLTAQLRVVGAAGSFTVDGSASVSSSGVTTSLRITQLHYTEGDCYPDGGTVTVTQGRVSQVITFSAETADTGVVTVTTGRRTTTDTLPAYGSCPAA